MCWKSLSRIRLAGAALLFLLLPQSPAAAASEIVLAQPNAARFPNVTLYPLPRDERGAVVPRIGRDRWKVFEDGKQAELVDVVERAGHVEVCLAIDGSLSMSDGGKIEQARRAAILFLNALGREDRSGLVLFGERSYAVQSLTYDHRLVAGKVNRIRARGEGTVLLDGLWQAVSLVALKPEGNLVTAPVARADSRRVVLALTDGLDTHSRVVAQHLIEYARANGVSICTIALGVDAASSDLAYLAQATGGLALEAPHPSSLGQLYLALARQLRSEYRVTYRSPNPAFDSRRRDVQIRAQGFDAQAEGWYQAPGRGSLLVVAPPTTGDPADPAAAGSGGGTGLPASLLLAALAVPLLILGGAAAWLFYKWRSERPPASAPVGSPAPAAVPALWVRPGITRIGRGSDLELTLNDPGVSRSHARVEALVTGCFLFDEQSRNGTFLNGRRLRGSAPLHPGDLIRLGPVELQFAGILTSQAPPPDPAAPAAPPGPGDREITLISPQREGPP